MTSFFVKCPHCPCVFCTEADLKTHMSAMPFNAEDHLKKYQSMHKNVEYGRDENERSAGWRKSNYGDGFWCFASDMPEIASACRSNGKLVSGGYEMSLDPTGKYLRKKIAPM